MMDFFTSLNFLTILDLLGTFAFAISGIRLAATKNFDWFGAYVIGLVTAIGGGTTRDLLLNTTPFWMEDSSYLVVTALALLAMLFFKNKLALFNKTLFLFDAIGLGLFTVVGISKSLAFGFPFWVCIMMGTITGAVGGVLRDVLINEIPLLFRKDIYALACIAGGLVFYLCVQLGLSSSVTEITASLAIIFIRIFAVRFHIQLPSFRDNINSNAT